MSTCNIHKASYIPPREERRIRLPRLTCDHEIKSGTLVFKPNSRPKIHSDSLSKHLVQNTIESIRLGLLHKRAMVLFNLCEIRHQISFVRWNPLCPLEKLPEDEENGEGKDPVFQVSILSY
jgi:hypothetical protein